MKDNCSRLLGALGLAARARKLTFGTELTCEALERGQLYLVILSKEASQNTLKKVKRSCAENEVDVYEVDIDAQRLAMSVGKKRPVMTLGIIDKNFTDLVQRTIGDDAYVTAFSQTYSESEV